MQPDLEAMGYQTYAEANSNSAEEMLQFATGFQLPGGLTLEPRGEGRWAVCFGGGFNVMEDLSAELEPRPMKQSPEFQARAQFPLVKAFRIAREFVAACEEAA